MKKILITILLSVFSTIIFAECSDEEKVEMLNAGVSAKYIKKYCEEFSDSNESSEMLKEESDKDVTLDESELILEDEEISKEKEFQKRVETIKERDFTVGLGLGLLYSGNRGGLLGALLLGNDKEFIVGFSAGQLTTPDMRSISAEYKMGSNFLLGYAKDNVFVIATSGAVGTWAKEKCVQEYSWREPTCTDGENGIVSGNAATIGYANIGGFKGFNISASYILNTDKDDEEHGGDDLKNTFEFSIGVNI